MALYFIVRVQILTSKCLATSSKTQKILLATPELVYSATIGSKATASLSMMAHSLINNAYSSSSSP